MLITVGEVNGCGTRSQGLWTMEVGGVRDVHSNLAIISFSYLQRDVGR